MVDYLTDKPECLTPQIVKFLTSLLKMLDCEGRLCDEAGSEIVFVYGYKGDFNAVRNQFKTYISFLKSKTSLSDDDRQFLLEKSERHGAFKHPDNYREMAKQAHREGKKELFFEYLEKSDNRRKKWHDEKQCLCFCNH